MTDRTVSEQQILDLYSSGFATGALTFGDQVLGIPPEAMTPWVAEAITAQVRDRVATEEILGRLCAVLDGEAEWGSVTPVPLHDD